MLCPAPRISKRTFATVKQACETLQPGLTEYPGIRWWFLDYRRTTRRKLRSRWWGITSSSVILIIIPTCVTTRLVSPITRHNVVALDQMYECWEYYYPLLQTKGTRALQLWQVNAEMMKPLAAWNCNMDQYEHTLLWLLGDFLYSAAQVVPHSRSYLRSIYPRIRLIVILSGISIFWSN